MFLTSKNFAILLAAAEKADAMGASCTGVTGKHARSAMRTIIGELKKTPTGFSRHLVWESLDGKTKKDALFLVDTTKKIAFLGFEGTPDFSNYSFTPFELEFMVDGKRCHIRVETSEQAYKLLCAIIFQDSAGFGECVEAILCAETVFAATQATKKLTDFLPLCFDNVFRDDVMMKALQAKWSNPTNSTQLHSMIFDLFAGTGVKPTDLSIAEFNEHDAVWGIPLGIHDKVKETKDPETGAVITKTTPGLMSLCEKLEFDVEKCIAETDKLGSNKLGKMITELYRKYKVQGDKAFPKSACDIVVMNKRPYSDPMRIFFAHPEAPEGIDAAAYNKERARFQKAYGSLADE